MSLAAELQSALLPEKCPDDCPHQVAAARNRMCKSIGGDFYDFIRINEDQIVVVIGDVVGHGVRASMVMTRLMGYLHSHMELLARPRHILMMLNRMLIELGDKIGKVLPCSMLYAVIDAPTGTSFFVNAGHPQPFLCEGDTCRLMPTGKQDLMLGISQFEPSEGCHTFTTGQRLVLYTDGVTDAEDENGDHFGLDRLQQTIDCHKGSGPEACADAAFRDIDEFRKGWKQIDDETIIVIDRV